MSWGSLEERTEFMRTLDHPRLTLLILAQDATWKVSGQWVCTLWMRIKRGFVCVYVFAHTNMELGCTEICTGCFMDFNCNIMLLSIAVNMQSALVKVVQELKIRNNFVCSHILRTSDSVAATEQQNITFLWSHVSAEFDELWWLCLEQISLEAHLLTRVKPKSCSVCLNRIRLCKSCVLQTEANFTQMHSVIVHLHPKPYIESKPKKSEAKAWLPI